MNEVDQLSAAYAQAQQQARVAVKDLVFAAIPFLMAFAGWRAARAAKRALADELAAQLRAEVEVSTPAEHDGIEEAGDD